MTEPMVGAPSMVHVGSQTCAGEVWVSPGVGERMIAYLKRTYQGVATPSNRETRGRVSHNDLLPEPPPRPRDLTPCAVCGVLFERHGGRCARCPACRGQSGRRYVVCQDCGVEFTTDSNRTLRCPECRVEHAHAASRVRMAARRARKRGGGVDICDRT
jgi:predicted Zn-ribbon and HTH transcriptional regulator